MAKNRGRKANKVNFILPDGPDYGTPELLKQHVAPKVWDADPEGSGRPVLHRKVMTQTMIGRYRVKGFITPRQHEAGIRLSKDFRMAGLDAFVSVDLVRGGGSGSPSFGIPTSEAAASARQKLRQLFLSVGSGIARVLTAVVHDDVDVLRMDAPCSGNKTQQRAALAGMVGMALEAAADYYGLPVEKKSR